MAKESGVLWPKAVNMVIFDWLAALRGHDLIIQGQPLNIRSYDSRLRYEQTYCR